MQITPNNVLPQVGQVAFQPNVNVPEGGVYQSLALGMQMLDQPVKQRIALEQLEQVKANTELSKQRLDLQLQEFDFRKQEIERQNIKDVETLREGTFAKTNALLGIKTLTDEEEATLNAAFERHGINQEGVNMLMNGNEAQIRGMNANLMKVMGDRDVMKIIQKNVALDALSAAYLQSPQSFDGAAVSKILEQGHLDHNLTANDFNPSKFLKQVNPEDELQQKYTPLYTSASPQGKVYLEQRVLSDLEKINPGVPMTDDAGQILPEWQEKVDFILSKNVMSAEQMAASLSNLADVLGITDPQQRASYTKNAAEMIELSRELGGERGAREMLLLLRREAGTEARATLKGNVDLQKENIKSNTKLQLQANEPVKGPKGPTETKMGVDQYGEAVGAFFGGSLGSESKQAAKYMYEKFGVGINNQEEANNLQAWVKEAGGNPNKGAGMYIADKLLPVFKQNNSILISRAVREVKKDSKVDKVKIQNGKVMFTLEDSPKWNEVSDADLIKTSVLQEAAGPAAVDYMKRQAAPPKTTTGKSLKEEFAEDFKQ